jgi:hypothetical protein
MSDFKVKASSYESTPAPAGLHPLRCYGIYDVGTQKEEFEGHEKEQRKVVLSFELVGTRHAFDKTKPKEKKPFSINQTVTASFGPRSKMRKWLKGMNGRDYDKKVKEISLVNELLDVPCQGQLVRNQDDTWTNIEALLPAAKGKTPELFNKTCVFTLDPENFDKEGYDALPGWIQEKIKASKEFGEILASGALAEKTPPKKGSAKAAPAKAPAKKAKK